MSTESSQWRKFLQPVVTGLVALMAAGDEVFCHFTSGIFGTGLFEY